MATRAETALQRPMVATVIVPDKEDPAALLARGGLDVSNPGRDGSKTKKFNEKPFPYVVDRALELPEFFLHVLDARFRVQQHEFDHSLRCGNDLAEVQMVLPEMYTESSLPHNGGTELDAALETTMSFLQLQATVPVSAVSTNGSGPTETFSATSDPSRWYFSLKTARPKADVNLGQEHGIPEKTQMYAFAENHVSVTFMSSEQKDAVFKCIELLENEDANWKAFAVFLKAFIEGGFTYIWKEPTGTGSFLPRMTGVAALGRKPAFRDQKAIETGFPCIVRPEFLKFSESVPVTIQNLKDMSDRHGRYGLCFTRCVWLWEDPDFATTKELSFCSMLPHGGFFYVPGTAEDFHKLGGLVYAFGDDKECFQRKAAEAPAAGKLRQQFCPHCLGKIADHAVFPCGHRGFCEECSKEVVGQDCPLCSERIERTERIVGGSA